MGCAQSRIENEESVSRCKDRKQFMRDAVAARNAFAAAHSSYTMSLKNSGAALSDFGHGESQHHQNLSINQPALDPKAASSSSVSASASVVQPPMDSLPPPPPPLPDFSPSPLQRAATMPEIPKKFQHSKSPADPGINEDEEDGEIEEEEEEEVEEPQLRREKRNDHKAPEPAPQPPPPPPPDSRMGTWDYFFANYDGMQGGSLHSEEIEEPVTPEKGVVEPPMPPPPPPETPPMMTPPEGLPPRPEKKKKRQQGVNVHHQHAASASAVETKKGKMAERTGAVEKKSVSLLQVLIDLDDHFLKASESAHEVSKMLEANRMHYHSNFADNRGIFNFGFEFGSFEKFFVQ